MRPELAWEAEVREHAVARWGFAPPPSAEEQARARAVVVAMAVTLGSAAMSGIVMTGFALSGS